MNQQAAGVESSNQATNQQRENGSCVQRIVPGRLHLRLVQVTLHAQSDFHNELVHESEWLLHPAEHKLRLSGNLFLLEDTSTGNGWIFIKEAPLPDERAVKAEADLAYVPGQDGHELHLLAHPDEVGRYPWSVLTYGGGKRGSIRALHGFQQSCRAGHLPELLTNTWGDRSQDSRICHEFMMQEIAAAARLGADVVQIDDGWQAGMTSNSASAKDGSGTWGSFASSRADFWSVHPERFPQGLDPLVHEAHKQGVALGLWFAPDSTNDYALFEQDAKVILDLFHSLGIRHFKIDGVRTTSALGEDRIRRFFELIAEGSGQQVIFDLDITAGVRPGYFGLMSVERLFVENRYTDWHGYWPHQTLRNFWKLCRWIDPRRLRMEFLNPTRNPNKHPEDPLAPSAYPIQTLFASVMLGAPLAWLEVSQLSSDLSNELAPLVALWREYREELYAGDILSIGNVPDGWSWTGFASVDREDRSMHILVFRECHIAATTRLPLPIPPNAEWEVTKIAGIGFADLVEDNSLCVTIPDMRNFVWVRMAKKERTQ